MRISRINIKHKTFLSILLAITLSVFLTARIAQYIGNAIINTADAIIKRENAVTFKNAFTKKNELNIDADKLINIYKNSKDEIVEVDFNIKECERMMLSIVEEMNKNTNSISENGIILNIPLGYITNSPFLINLGPKIPVKLTTTDVVLGEVKTEVKELNINSALVELYINFEVETNAILPLKSGTTKQKYTALVASKMITGTIPEFYNGAFFKKSSTFNLPITENM